jgi:RNA polymerase sigma factor (TIGR02999 family)
LADAEEELVTEAADGPAGDVTRFLRGIRDGDAGALDRLFPIVYEELRQLAGRQVARERSDSTLQATGLVHEAYLKLAAGKRAHASDRAHFLAIAARAMRQVLVDHARRRQAERRGAGWARTTLTDGMGLVELDLDEILALDAALGELDPHQRQVVECRFFGGMTETEVAEALGVSPRTVGREWAKARAWLYSSLYPDPPSS